MITQRSYLPALERMIGKEGRCPPDQALTTEYLAALNGLIDDGRINLQQGRYKEAGASLGRVYDSLQREKERLPSVSSSRLQRDMDVCAERLMREGLKEYRQGNLEQAIGIWQQIIRFQPGHREARRSIRTARVQLTNLEHFETRP
jgi:tetratricopeptide (TPR) repeat protein